MTEQVQEIRIDQLRGFKDHPFQVKDHEELQALCDSIREYGVLSPLLARPTEDGYEIVSGHRRKAAALRLGLDKLPVLVRNMTDDEAIILMVDSNIQRENLLPSEKAFAYKMKLEAIKHQGARSDLTSSQVGMKLQAMDIVGQQAGESRNQVHRYIRLTHLIPEILDMVDNKRIALNPAVELSYLTPAEQELLVVTMDSEQATPSLSQAQRLKRFSQSGKLTEESMLAIMSEEKKQDVDRVTFTRDTLKKFFPRDYTPRQMEETILKLLQGWSKKRQQGHER